MSGGRPSGSSEVGNWLALLLIAGFGGFFALAMLAPGIVLLNAEPHSESAPREMDYASFARSRPYDEWLRLGDCMLSVPSALSMNDPRAPDEIFIPVLDPNSESEEVRLLLRTSHPKYTTFIAEIEAFEGTPEELDAWLLDRRGLAYPVVTIEGTVDEYADEIGDLKAALPEATYDLAILTDGGEPPPPSSTTALVLIVIGMVVGLGTIAALVLLRRWQLRPRLSGPRDIAQVFADTSDRPPIEIDQAAALLRSRAGVYSADDGEGEGHLDDDVAVVYRRGHTVIVEEGAGDMLPARCIKCNAVVPGRRLRRSVGWHHPAIFILLLVSPLIYIIVALIVRKSMVVWISLCGEHRKRRSMFIGVGWGGFGLAVLMVILGAAQRMDLVLVLGFICALAFPLIGLLGARTIRALRIEDDEAHLAGFCDAFVAELPTASSVGREW